MATTMEMLNEVLDGRDAEIARLRSALEEIEAMSRPPLGDDKIINNIAREALEREP